MTPHQAAALLGLPLGLLLSLLLVALPVQSLPPADARATREAEVRAELARLQDRLLALGAEQRAALAARGDAATALREVEQAVAQADERRQQAEQALALADRGRGEAEARLAGIDAALSAQRGQLAALLRLLHFHGRHLPLRWLLGQQRIERQLLARAYLRHLQQDSETRLRALLALQQAQSEARIEFDRQHAQQLAAAAAAQAAAQALLARRDEQAEMLAAIEVRLRAQEGQLRALRRDREAMTGLLASLRDVLADIPARLEEDRPFAARRGQLPRPLEGRVQLGFGGAIAGGQGSSGVRLLAAHGTPVRAVAPGRVVFADWMRGHGRLLILDHGDGWLSLYAHLDRLSREVGEWVGEGAVLGTAGSSGGEPQPGVHFELRRNGVALDPAGWWRSR